MQIIFEVHIMSNTMSMMISMALDMEVLAIFLDMALDRRICSGSEVRSARARARRGNAESVGDQGDQKT